MAKTTKEETVDATSGPTISAANCPEKESHARRLNQKCTACGEVIPGHGMYTPDEFQRYFAPPGYGQYLAPHPVFETPEMQALKEKQAALWIEHERLRLAHEDAVFAVEDLKRGRAGARGPKADGAVGASFDARIAAATERVEALHEGTAAVLQEINKIDQIRKGKHQRALWEESYPADAAPGSIAARIAAAIRGSGA